LGNLEPEFGLLLLGGGPVICPTFGFVSCFRCGAAWAVPTLGLARFPPVVHSHFPPFWGPRKGLFSGGNPFLFFTNILPGTTCHQHSFLPSSRFFSVSKHPPTCSMHFGFFCLQMETLLLLDPRDTNGLTGRVPGKLMTPPNHSIPFHFFSILGFFGTTPGALQHSQHPALTPVGFVGGVLGGEQGAPFLIIPLIKWGKLPWARETPKGAVFSGEGPHPKPRFPPPMGEPFCPPPPKGTPPTGPPPPPPPWNNCLVARNRFHVFFTFFQFCLFLGRFAPPTELTLPPHYSLRRGFWGKKGGGPWGNTHHNPPPHLWRPKHKQLREGGCWFFFWWVDFSGFSASRGDIISKQHRSPQTGANQTHQHHTTPPSNCRPTPHTHGAWIFGHLWILGAILLGLKSGGGSPGFEGRGKGGLFLPGGGAQPLSLLEDALSRGGFGPFSGHHQNLILLWKRVPPPFLGKHVFLGKKTCSSFSLSAAGHGGGKPFCLSVQKKNKFIFLCLYQAA